MSFTENDIRKELNMREIELHKKENEIIGSNARNESTKKIKIIIKKK